MTETKYQAILAVIGEGRTVAEVVVSGQMPAEVEAMVLEWRRAHRYWGARRLALELARRGVEPAPSEAAVYRCLVRAAAIDPVKRHRRNETWISVGRMATLRPPRISSPPRRCDC